MRIDERNRKWWTLGAVSFALFMVMLDNTIVNVALPSIGKGLAIGVSELEWVVNAYTLSFAVFMLTGGRLADLYGRRLVFETGLVVFTVSSLACGLAPDAATLIAARSFQGAGAALMMPATLSIISAAFAAEERGTAIGIWAGVSASALAIGPLLGGLLTEHIGWSWVFFVNVPVGAVAFVASFFLIVESRSGESGQRLDLPGLFASAGGLLALVYALIEGNHYGWTSARILGLLLAAAVLLDGVRRDRVAQCPTDARPDAFPQPHLQRRERRRPPRLAGDVRDLLLRLALHAEHPRLQPRAHRRRLPADDDPRRRLGAARREADRRDRPALADHDRDGDARRRVCSSSRGSARAAGFLDLLPGMVIGGIGMGVAMGPMTTAALSAVSVDEAGVASGVVTTSRQVGGALGIAVMGAIVAAAETVAQTDPRFPLQFVDGFQHALEAGAAIALVGALLSAVLIRRERAVPRPAGTAPRTRDPIRAQTTAAR